MSDKPYAVPRCNVCGHHKDPQYGCKCTLLLAPPEAKTSTNLQVAEKPDSLRAIFDIDRLQGELEYHLPKALRTIADAIEAGDLDGTLMRFYATASDNYYDQRVHNHVSLRLSAPIRKLFDLDKLEAVHGQD